MLAIPALTIPTEHSGAVGLRLGLDSRTDRWTDIFQQHSPRYRPMVLECSVGIASIGIATVRIMSIGIVSELFVAILTAVLVN